MRPAVAACLIGVAGFLAGAWLVGIVVFGVAVMVVSLGMVAVGLLHDDGRPTAAPREPGVLERFAREP